MDNKKLNEAPADENRIPSEPFTPEYEVCPMLESNAVDYYNLSKKEIDQWCRLGCSPTCGTLLKEKMERREKKAAKAREGRV